MEVRIQSVVVEFILNNTEALFSPKLNAIIRESTGRSFHHMSIKEDTEVRLYGALMNVTLQVTTPYPDLSPCWSAPRPQSYCLWKRPRLALRRSWAPQPRPPASPTVTTSRSEKDPELCLANSTQSSISQWRGRFTDRHHKYRQLFNNVSNKSCSSALK